ncbi:DNA/RNA nuclease SfsA [filamentous cyanobacterium LEGE 11480]|uniref:Sugar fermentation stimulation protein homolog n=1 Tax=Romeriopsis navalis LEGE 11480 TaxID=2777977 RepID=A0A928VUS9_9CYAN|nr:DNA/RNA nuclease SfsA [Romeriopsis navalis]MBE9032965.1 DNA/RNA nuclease SfsA [Romeriopsis navalis LEGE 11480]
MPRSTAKSSTPSEPTYIYEYPQLYSGTLLKRYKRFFADIELDSGEQITAHCPNTGPMTGVCEIGNRVQVSLSDNKKRKLPYTWELIELHDNEQPVWVGVNTSLPNRVIRNALEQRIFTELTDYTEVRREVPYGQERSRVDFLLEGAAKDIYVEVKNTTWTDGTIAVFPDTVTTRGQKHIREMISLLPEYRAVMLYFINRGDCDRFAPGDDRDPEYGQLLRAAMSQGMEVLPCRFQVDPVGIQYLGLADLSF